MDPNAVHATCRRLVAEIFAREGSGADYESARELAEAFGALDEWLTFGGFLPAVWAPPE